MMFSKSIILALLPAAFAAPLIIPRDETLIPNKYIVKLKPDASIADVEAAQGLLANAPDFEYDFGGFRGFAGYLSPDAVTKLQDSGAVEWIQQDAEVHTQTWLSESGAPWGLGRISHEAKGSDTYVYDSTAGEGTCSYIIDTGIYVDHPEFEGRAEWLENFTGDGQDSDGAGHGTHVAGTVGSKTYGVAKKTKLLAVKVLDAGGSGTFAGVIAGIQFASEDQKTRDCPKGSVANMSLGGGRNTAVNEAVAAGVAAGLFFGVAAGNNNANAANYSPASEASACTVGATDSNDAKASFSNYGDIVDVFAPGVQVLSTWNDGKTNSISGTSMATPHVVGLAAYLLAFEGISTDALCARIVELAHQGVITGLPSGTKNLLAFNGAQVQ
ncbi:subtilisin-like serine protease-like protein PR1A [Aaosphaeria arxii CBS 175.79]|uniref:Subtilisin-like serine protease-like protein PR1A n=1 Tax=Aaosphaeria arxii CBS 175.79 TaxID=1450172 RepID=A0A6A5Y5Z5_9PLEO|nr:subtilisin-like serine protease-like protein PR1A [Aaosphaeria arxii CBS 175.79]KAF2020972.1 subtilisin-like serine protease-like protein PR1A [Aaosphaeria arxii CBS 175.79]